MRARAIRLQNRLSKKDKQDLVGMFNEFVDGMERDMKFC